MIFLLTPNVAGNLTLGSADNTLTSLNGLAVTITSGNALTLTDGTASLVLGGTGAVSLTAATTVALDCTGAFQINSSAGLNRYR